MSHSKFHAFGWSAFEQVGRQALRFVLSVLLARLLSPDEYGLMGMLLVFLMLAQTFADSGLSAALIQRKEISQDDETSVFYLNIGAGVMLAGILCAVSPVVAAFYHQPLLIPMLCACSVGVVASSFGIVQTALLTRDVDFAAQAKVSLIATTVSGGVAIVMAWHGFGVWSLVAQSVLQSAAAAALLWVYRPWRPTGRFQWERIRSMWGFSSKLLASGLLNTFFESLYTLIIGKLYRPADLGFYTRASTLAQLPASSVTSMTQRVMFPVFSKLQEDKPRMKAEMRRVVRLLAAFHFPMMAGLAAVAKPLVLCLLTQKWLPCVPYFQVLCFAGMLYPLHALNLNVMTAQGRSDLFLRLEVAKKVLTVMVLATTFWLGVGAMVAGILVHSLISLGINNYYNRRLLDYGWAEQVCDVLPMAMASLGVAAAVSTVALFEFWHPWALLLAQCVIGTTLYGMMVIALRNNAYADVVDTVSGVLRRLGFGVPSGDEVHA